MALGRPRMMGSQARRTRSSRKALETISGPMPAGSPRVMAMRGFGINGGFFFEVTPAIRKPGSSVVDVKAAGSRVSTRLATRPAGCVEGRLTPCRDDGLLEDYSKLLTLISALERRSFT